jgi:hypothetical protein
MSKPKKQTEIIQEVPMKTGVLKKETMQKLPLSAIVGQIYGKKLAKWWLRVPYEMLDKFEGGEVVLFQLPWTNKLKYNENPHWIYAVYLGKGKSNITTDAQCKGQVSIDYYFEVSSTEKKSITYDIPYNPSSGKFCQAGWRGGPVAVFDTEIWKKNHRKKT